MSHFCVLVIGYDPEEQLAPYHEFESTGNDEFVQEVDITEESRAKYMADETRMYEDPEGRRYEPYDDRFYREPTSAELKKIGPIPGTGYGHGMSWSSRDWGDGRGYRPKIHFLPEHWKEVKLMTREVKTFQEFIEYYYGLQVIPELDGHPRLDTTHKYGWVELHSTGEVKRVVDRTNPSAKWDWYQIGGRWSGYLRLKEGADGKMGELTLLANDEQRAEWLKKHGQYADQTTKGNVDFEAMRAEAAFDAGALYDKVNGILQSHPDFKPWDVVEAKYGPDKFDEARKFYHNQPATKELSKLDFFLNPKDFTVPREAYVEARRKSAVTTFAVLKNGKWYESGEMGWWGAVSDKKDEQDWNTEFDRLLDTTSDDTLLTVVDCHI